MVAPIKQVVTVGPDGKIEIARSGLPPGAQAEVTVVQVEDAVNAEKPMTPLEAFRALQKSMNLDRAAAEKWVAENRELRNWNRPRQ